MHTQLPKIFYDLFYWLCTSQTCKGGRVLKQRDRTYTDTWKHWHFETSTDIKMGCGALLRRSNLGLIRSQLGLINRCHSNFVSGYAASTNTTPQQQASSFSINPFVAIPRTFNSVIHMTRFVSFIFLLVFLITCACWFPYNVDLSWLPYKNSKFLIVKYWLA